MVVGKVLRSLGLKFNSVVPSIEEMKDLMKLTLDELSSSLQAHKAQLLRQIYDHVVEKAFSVKNKTFSTKDEDREAVKDQ